ncbi:hypothetical protein [Neobacillus thermocopriae]|nr:hypothetical protein [Neobacillus thermocopriae]
MGGFREGINSIIKIMKREKSERMAANTKTGSYRLGKDGAMFP